MQYKHTFLDKQPEGASSSPKSRIETICEAEKKKIGLEN